MAHRRRPGRYDTARLPKISGELPRGISRAKLQRSIIAFSGIAYEQKSLCHTRSHLFGVSSAGQRGRMVSDPSGSLSAVASDFASSPTALDLVAL